MKKLLLTFLCATCLFCASTQAENIGYIDTQRIMQEYKEVKKFQDSIKKKLETYKKKYTESEEKIKKAKEKKKSDEHIEKLIAKIESELLPQKQEILQLESAFENRMIGEISSVSKIIAKDYGIDIVLNKNAILTGGFDLTEFVLTKLNE
eukprot:COSAG01_NODE_2_length_63927_cov_1357.611941_43_plen_150_part_00